MEQTNRQTQIEKAELIISHLLRWGVILCILVISTGWAMSNQHVVMAGLFLLILLPISRVFSAAVIFFFQKDYVYVWLSLYVLAVLITSLLLGKEL